MKDVCLVVKNAAPTAPSARLGRCTDSRLLKRATSDGNDVSKATEVEERIHVDLVGPTKEALRGDKCAFVASDGNSDYPRAKPNVDNTAETTWNASFCAVGAWQITL